MEQVVRLYLGYLGNLGERVPELAGFWLLTILLQLPMQVILPHNHNPHDMSRHNLLNQFSCDNLNAVQCPDSLKPWFSQQQKTNRVNIMLIVHHLTTSKPADKISLCRLSSSSTLTW